MEDEIEMTEDIASSSIAPSNIGLDTENRYYVTYDNDGYALYVSSVGEGDYLTSLDGYDLSGDRIRYHHLVGGALVFDDAKYQSEYVDMSSAVEVSQLDRIEAQVAYTALRTGTLIGG